MFRDRNFVTALVLIFMVGIILLAGLALLPPMLQNIFGYPVVTTGMVLAPRGVGTMISMIVVGRLVGKVDARLLIFAGLSLTAYSLWQMTGFSPAMDWRPLVVSGVVQGLGLGLVFVPLSHARLRDARAAVPRRRGVALQPGAQHRLVGRHLDRRDACSRTTWWPPGPTWSRS